ncbi:MAG TPA: T9SS type A sorting domain-containing protein, partial [Candidatus Kapabacteria bacterium]
FAVPQNDENKGGKYVQLDVTSNKATTVNVSITGGTIHRFPIKAYEAASFNVPLAWEVTTSGIIEEKGIHVWSNNADLTVDMLCRNTASSDGTNILPIGALGTQYVVGAYHSLYGGHDSSTYDHPSEFMVIAPYDSTAITITPSSNIRWETDKNIPLHQKGDTFTVVLNKGECIQYKASPATDADNFDLSGTVIRSSKPIGVIGSVQCANVPVSYPYCDFLCEMLPPVSAWGTSYNTLPFANADRGDLYLVIGSKKDQIIKQNAAAFVVNDSFDKRYILGAFGTPSNHDSHWSSTEPFMLAHYICSYTYDIPANGNPAMMMHLPTTKYSKTVIFQTPTIPAGQGGFSNYADVMVHDSAIATTTFDGQPIAQRQATDRLKIHYNSNYTGFRVRSLTPGTHIVTSDSGVNVNIYGYGSNDSYAWSGPTKVQTGTNNDITSPLAQIIESKCDCATVIMRDTGVGSSKLAEIAVDSLVNMTFSPDPTFIAGGGFDTTFYSFCVIDRSKDSYIEVSAYDLAGNRTRVTSHKEGRSSTSNPTIRIAYPGANIANYAEHTVTNTTPGTLTLSGADGLRLAKGTTGFSLVSPDLTDLAPDSSRVFLVKYQSSSRTTARDTLLLSNECNLLVTPITSFDPNTEMATARGKTLPCIPFGAKVQDTAAYIVSDYIYLLTIDSITIDDKDHFTITAPSLPSTLSMGNRLYVIARYDASVDTGTYTSLIHFYTKEAGKLTVIVTACVEAAISVRDDNPSNYNELATLLQQGKKFGWLSPTPNPSVPAHPVSFTFGLSHSADVALELFDISGKRAALITSERFEPGIHECYLETKAIARGAYIYRYTIEGKSYTGKLVVE